MPADHAGFPPPTDEGGDVKNLADSPGYLNPNSQEFASNDSFWIDLDHPVLTAADGRKFKPLFAPLIVDLDNRVNVNVHGHLMEAATEAVGEKQQGLYENGRHMSTQGWGPWEVNLERVLSEQDSPHHYEARRIFTGVEGVPGRYDPAFWSFDKAGATPPYNTLDAFYRRSGQFYSRSDYEAEWVDKRPNEFGTNQLFRLVKSSPFPSIPGWYANGGESSEGGFHAQLFNFFDPRYSTFAKSPRQPRKDRIYPIADMEALLRYGDTGSPALASDLFRVCPRTLGDPVKGGKARRLITTHAFDVDYPGIWADPRLAPTIGMQPIDLNRTLPNYPGLNAQKRFGNLQDFNRAQEARQQLAQEIFDVLRQVAGGNQPPAGPDELRRLAQLAVNIVDFRDEDDIITPFAWQGQDYVFGNELPRVVVSEAYAELANHPDDEDQSMAKKPFQLRFWVELHNPLKEGLRLDGGMARLQRPDDSAAYRLVIAEKASENATKLNEPANTTGEVDAVNIKIEVDDFGGAMAMPKPEIDKDSYLIIGPKEDFPGDDPSPLLEVPDDGDKNRMYYEVPSTEDPAEKVKTTHTILLRRLACPYLPEQTDPAQPQYNPFVTIDTLELNDPINDAVGVTRNGKRMNPPETVSDESKRFSVGREQPYAAALVKDQKSNPATPDQPQHTLGEQNEPKPTNERPYRWLTFMDRPLVSPVELLHVSGQPPHGLTRRFITEQNGQLTLFGHRAPWLDEDLPPGPDGRRTDTHGLYRLFGYLRAGTLLQGSCVGGRVIGRNINTIWDVETLMALADPYRHNHYDELAVDNNDPNQPGAFQKMMRVRTPDGSPGPHDRPFLGQAVPFSAGEPRYPVGIGLEDTFFRADPADPNRRLFEIDPMKRFADADQARQHPYLKYEMMMKMYNQVTTRSNVFAVWLTVGFFEVVDDGGPSRPPRLGPEVGLAEGRAVRHRMFAIIDRSNLTVHPSQPGTAGPRPFAMNTESEIREPGQASVQVPWVRGQYEDVRYEIRAGDQLVIDVGPNQELIRVISVDSAANTVTAVFSKPHPRGVPISNILNGLRDPGSGQPIRQAGALPVTDPKLTWLGNPGPQPRFDMRSPAYAGVVRYFSIIE